MTPRQAPQPRSLAALPVEPQERPAQPADGLVAPEALPWDAGPETGRESAVARRRREKAARPPEVPGKRKRTLRQSKDAERRVAKLLGGVRLPTDGKTNLPDVDCGWMVVEVKNFPIWQRLKDAVYQAKRAAAGRKGAPLPTVALVDKPGHGGQEIEVYMVVEIADWIQWNGGAK